MVGDQALFQRAAVVTTAWSVIESIQDLWQALPAHFPNYAPNTWGLKGAHDLIARDGRQWREIEKVSTAAA